MTTIKKYFSTKLLACVNDGLRVRIGQMTGGSVADEPAVGSSNGTIYDSLRGLQAII
jgi:hypothetical protein